MNLSIHLALTLYYEFYGHSHIYFSWNEPVLSFLFVLLYRNLYNTRPEYWENSSDQTSARKSSVKLFLYLFSVFSSSFCLFIDSLSKSKNSYFIHRLSVQHCIKKGQSVLLFLQEMVYIHMSVLYRINSQRFLFS